MRLHLDIREEGFQHVGAGVAGVEEHQLGLLQMARGETLLDVHVFRVKADTPAIKYRRQAYSRVQSDRWPQYCVASIFG